MPTILSEHNNPDEIKKVEADEGCKTFWLEGKFQIFCRFYASRTSSPAKGSLFILHGYSEHSGRYAHVAKFFAERSYDVFSLDFPGFGRSGGLRSSIQNFDDYQNAFELLLAEAQRRKGAQPFHLLAHSMGGLVALRFAETSYLSAQIRTLAISSPLLGLANISVAALPWLNRLCHLLPNIAIKNEGKLGTSVLSHDKELMQSREDDPLIKSQARPLWIKGFIAARILAFQDIKKLLTPTGFFIAGDERVTSRPEAERFFKLLSGVKKIHIYEGLLHEIVNEVERDRVIKDIFQWIDSGGNLAL